MVEEGGLRGCYGYNGSLSISENDREWDIYSVVVEEEDFDACCAIDNLGNVTLHSFDNIHGLNFNLTLRHESIQVSRISITTEAFLDGITDNAVTKFLRQEFVEGANIAKRLTPKSFESSSFKSLVMYILLQMETTGTFSLDVESSYSYCGQQTLPRRKA